jgi:hypothetical protein
MSVAYEPPNGPATMAPLAAAASDNIPKARSTKASHSASLTVSVTVNTVYAGK